MTNSEKKKLRSKHQPTGSWIRSDKRLAIYLRDGFQCIYCLKDLSYASPMDITLDHLKTKSDQGNNHESNLITACRSCNCSRQDKPLSRFTSKETIQHIRRNTRRSLKKYRVLARAFLSGEFNHTDTSK